MQFIQILSNIFLLIQFVLGNDSFQHSFSIPAIQSSEKQRRVEGGVTNGIKTFLKIILWCLYAFAVHWTSIRKVVTGSMVVW